MSKLNFNLQLFADDDTVSLDTLKEQGFTDEELQEVLPKEEPEPTPEPEPQPEPEPEPSPEPTPEPAEQEPAPDSDKVSKHVPYDRFKEVNERNKVLAAELAALKAQQTNQQPTQQIPQQPSQQVQTQQQQTNISEQISKMADEKVRKDLDITDDIETLQYSDPKKYLQYVKSVAKEEYKLESQYEQRQTVFSQNKAFVQELAAQKDFPVLYQFALSELDELPGKQSRPIEQAFYRVDQGQGSKEDIEKIRKFANECREKMNGITTQPPTTQAAISTPVTQATSPLDKAAGLPRAQSLSGAKTSAISWTQVEDLIRQGKTDQIPKDMLKQIDPRLLE